MIKVVCIGRLFSSQFLYTFPSNFLVLSLNMDSSILNVLLTYSSLEFSKYADTSGAFS